MQIPDVNSSLLQPERLPMMTEPEFYRTYSTFKNKESVTITTIQMIKPCERSSKLNRNKGPKHFDIIITLQNHALNSTTVLREAGKVEKRLTHSDYMIDDIQLAYLEDLVDLELNRFLESIKLVVNEKLNKGYMIIDGNISLESLSEKLMELYQPGPIPTWFEYFRYQLDNTPIDHRYEFTESHKDTDVFRVQFLPYSCDDFTKYENADIAWSVKGSTQDFTEIRPDDVTSKEYFLSTLYEFTPKEVLAAASMPLEFPFKLGFVCCKKKHVDLLLNPS